MNAKRAVKVKARLAVRILSLTKPKQMDILANAVAMNIKKCATIATNAEENPLK